MNYIVHGFEYVVHLFIFQLSKGRLISDDLRILTCFLVKYSTILLPEVTYI